MLPILQIGPFALQTPGLILLIGLWIALSIGEKQAPRFKITADLLYNLVFYSLAAGVLGARLGYAARFPQAFAASPGSLLSLNPGLLDLNSAIAVGLVSGLIYGQRKGLRLRPTLDALTPVLAVLAIALAMANAASGKAFGAASELPWAIQLWGAMRHPTQIYQLLAAGWIAWCVAPSRTENQQPEGTLFTKFVIYSAAAHLFLEAFRGDSILLPNGWRSTQVLAWSILAIGLWAYGRLQYPNHTEAAK